MLKFAKFIGANTDFSTAQAYLFPRVFPEDFAEPVFGLVISAEGEDVFIYVRQRILNLEDQFSAPFERVTEKLHELAETIKSEFSKVENLTFSLFCAKENVFYVLQSGRNIVEILRDGKLSPVVDEDNFQEKVVSGFLQPGDKVIVLSAKPISEMSQVNWDRQIVEQTANLELESVDDSEMIFVSDELKSENLEELAGVKNITPVAFIMIENFMPREAVKEKDSTFVLPRPEIKIRFKMTSFNPWIFIHKNMRRLFGFLRRINRKLLIGMLALLIILIIGGAGYLFMQGRNSQTNKRFDNLIASVETNLNEASAIRDTDSKQATEKISQARLRLAEAEGLDRENLRIAELKGLIEEKEAEVLRIYKNFSLELFISLDLIKQTYKTDRMSFSVGKILLLDTNEKSLVSIDTELKTPSILAGAQQFGNGQIASLNGSHAFVYSPDRGITHVDIDTRKASSVTAGDPEWGEIKDIFAFSSNIYALDSGKNQIWKYAPTESGYSGKIEYLRSEANLGLAKRLVIDFSVWVLTGQPDILKFTAGNSDFFALGGLNEPLTQIDDIFVPEELDSVFILDKFSNRILVTKKNGEYLAQYINPEFSKADDFFVDEEIKKVYLLIENKIYTTPLR